MTYECEWCGRAFTTRAARDSHEDRAHADILDAQDQRLMQNHAFDVDSSPEIAPR